MTNSTDKRVAANLWFQAESYRRMATMIDGDCLPNVPREHEDIWPMALVLRREARRLERQAKDLTRDGDSDALD